MSQTQKKSTRGRKRGRIGDSTTPRHQDNRLAEAFEKFLSDMRTIEGLNDEQLLRFFTKALNPMLVLVKERWAMVANVPKKRTRYTRHFKKRVRV